MESTSPVFVASKSLAGSHSLGVQEEETARAKNMTTLQEQLEKVIQQHLGGLPAALMRVLQEHLVSALGVQTPPPPIQPPAPLEPPDLTARGTIRKQQVSPERRAILEKNLKPAHAGRSAMAAARAAVSTADRLSQAGSGPETRRLARDVIRAAERAEEAAAKASEVGNASAAKIALVAAAKARAAAAAAAKPKKAPSH
jgi:hypothetical protein